MVSLKSSHFLHIIKFISRRCANIGKEVRLMFRNTYQEIHDTHTRLTFSKAGQNVCVTVPVAVRGQHPQAVFSCCSEVEWGFNCVIKVSVGEN